MLVGPTGGGKTTVRRILENALILLPIADLLSVTERQSASKVNDLLNKLYLVRSWSDSELQLVFYVLFT